MLSLREKRQEKGVESHPGKRRVCGKRLLEAEAIIAHFARKDAIACHKHERALIGGKLLERLIELLPLEARERLDRLILPRRSASAMQPALSLGRGIGARVWSVGVRVWRRGARTGRARIFLSFSTSESLTPPPPSPPPCPASRVMRFKAFAPPGCARILKSIRSCCSSIARIAAGSLAACIVLRSISGSLSISPTCA